MILQQDQPEDFVIATGITTTVRDFVRLAFQEVGVTLEFLGEGIRETGVVVRCEHPDFQLEPGKEVVVVDERYFRPAEVDLLIGDPAKCKRKLNWEPTYDLASLVKEMMSADIDYFLKEKMLQEAGYRVKNQFE